MNIDWDSLGRGQPALAAIPTTLREAAQLRRFAAGETLHRRGDRPTAMLWVLDGELRLVRTAIDGSVLILQRVRSGFIAEASMEAGAYHCDVMAAAAGHLLRFPLPVFRAVLEQDAAFRQAWMRRLAQEVRKLRAQNERLGLHSAAERILHYLETEGRDGALILPQSRKAWAAELGLSHEVLYRTLRRLREDGVIQIDGNRIARVS
ncbi:Crp/Fnr family transcriptional regulator [Sulfurivermis fontis]|uniref:Crp/Fnr family transcriptional regulator n=1 Tax=Sulfurivermis fontis TaxID=1972068 RepID=UPI000FD7B76E|nr:Crp/Fnr family transcriptional regulator [Sulfurivermis fontis]